MDRVCTQRCWCRSRMSMICCPTPCTRCCTSACTSSRCPGSNRTCPPHRSSVPPLRCTRCLHAQHAKLSAHTRRADWPGALPQHFLFVFAHHWPHASESTWYAPDGQDSSQPRQPQSPARLPKTRTSPLGSSMPNRSQTIRNCLPACEGYDHRIESSELRHALSGPYSNTRTF